MSSRHDALPSRAPLIVAGVCLALFAVLTASALFIDVAPIGPQGSSVGLSSINGAVFATLGSNDLADKTSDLLLVLSVLVCGAFAALGLTQLARTRSLSGVDPALIRLALAYLTLAVLYVGFEFVTLNYAPVLDEGQLKSSFPSSHTLATVAVFAMSPITLRALGANPQTTNPKLCNPATPSIAGAMSAVFILAAVVLRVLSGQHWLTDVIAGVLLALCVTALYAWSVEACRPDPTLRACHSTGVKRGKHAR